MPHWALLPNHWMDALSDSSWKLWTSQLPEQVLPSCLHIFWCFLCFSLTYKHIQKALSSCSPVSVVIGSTILSVWFSFVLANDQCPHNLISNFHSPWNSFLVPSLCYFYAILSAGAPSCCLVQSHQSSISLSPIPTFSPFFGRWMLANYWKKGWCQSPQISARRICPL